MSTLSYFHYPTPIIFGANSTFEIDEHLKHMNPKNVMIVADRGVCELPFFKTIKEKVELLSEVSIFNSFSPNPKSNEIDDVHTNLNLPTPDLIIGIGGGASLDAAKSLSVTLSHQKSILTFDEALGGDQKINGDILIPVWAVPTTSGTGSEVGRSAVVSDSSSGQKKIIFHPKMMPTLVFCDPVLTENLPAKITAQTGIDAFVHLFEAYCAPGFHPMADGIALEGMRLIEKSFLRSVNAPDLESRSNMMAAAMMGAVSFQKGLGNIHSCAHSLSACFDTHHGLANGVMLPYGAQVNLPFLGEKAKVVAQIIGGPSRVGEDLPHLLIELVSEAGLPTNLGAFGVTRDDVERLVNFAFEDGCHQTNATPMTKHLFQELFISAL